MNLHPRATRAQACREAGQTAIALVLLLIVILVTVGATLAVNAEAHDPLVQDDSLEHYAYRALEAGTNTLLSTLNEQPNFVTCSSERATGACKNLTGVTKTPIGYDQWVQVVGTTTTTTAIPEYFLWENPTFCFSTSPVATTACTTKKTNTVPTPTTSNPLEYVRITVVGAAGVGSRLFYQTSRVNFQPKNGFLTNVYWDNCNVVYPTLDTYSKGCGLTHDYDWQGSYTSEESPCTPITFVAQDHIAGPIFSNDSIYVRATVGSKGTITKVAFASQTGKAKSQVTTADPKCQFIGRTTYKSKTTTSKTTCVNADTWVTYTTKLSKFGASKEPIPPTEVNENKLTHLAAADGCLYQGPTTVSFYETKVTTGGTLVERPKMHVWSPETPRKTVGGTIVDTLNATTNKNKCFTSTTVTKTPTTTAVTVPSGVNATKTVTPNGVIYIKTSTTGNDGSGSCTDNHDNPLEGYVQTNSAAHTDAQMVFGGYYTGTSAGFNYTVDANKSQSAWDCEGDVFVRDARSATGKTPGIEGNITVAAQNNVMITGDLKYLDCGSTWTFEKTCPYNSTGSSLNDSLGLIATNFIEVSRPGVHKCTTRTVNKVTDTTCTAHLKTGTIQPNCKTTATNAPKTLTAVFCNPYTATAKGLIIDAAVLALQGSFVVNNWTDNSSNSTGSISNVTGHLYVYGAIDQDYRGSVGTYTGSTLNAGYGKYYVFDSRLQFVSVPHYLTPSSASWAVSSSSANLSVTLPTDFSCPYGTAGTTYITSWSPTTTKKAQATRPTSCGS